MIWNLMVARQRAVIWQTTSARLLLDRGPEIKLLTDMIAVLIDQGEELHGA